MKSKTLTISILLLTIILAPLAMADESRGHGPRGAGGPGRMRPGGPGGFQGGFGWALLGRVGDKLELTDAQREQIKAILDTCNPKDTRDAVAEAMKALREATAEGNKDAIIAAGKAAGDALTQRALKQADIMKQIKAVLTKEQLAKWEDLKAQMKERMQQRREGNFDGPRGRFNKDGKGQCDREPQKQGPRWE